MAKRSPISEGSTTPDVRMRGFARRMALEQAITWVDEHSSQLNAESVPLAELRGRVLADDIVAGIDVPTFDRSMMDGFAVRAEDTHGATPYNSLPLAVVGESLPGRSFDGELRRGQAVRIMTGAPLPAGADAVLPAEQTETRADQNGETVFARGSVPARKHVGPRGEDVRAGDVVLERGRVLRPQDVGVLAAVGMATASVVRRPVVRLVITGNELLSPGNPTRPHHVFDANGPMLTGLAQRDGGVVQQTGITPDEPEMILQAMQGGPPPDVVLVSGGSSVGQEDHAARLLAEYGQLAIHGIAIRPSSPTGLGLLPVSDRPANDSNQAVWKNAAEQQAGHKQQAIVVLLPGNPVSCLCAYDFFAGRAIRAVGGRAKQWPYVPRRMQLRRKLVSQVGRVDYARVRFVDDDIDDALTTHPPAVEPIAIGGASVLTSTVRACGFVVIPADSEGFAAGSEVDVWMYDSHC